MQKPEHSEDHPAFEFISSALAICYGADEVGDWDAGAAAIITFLYDSGFEITGEFKAEDADA